MRTPSLLMACGFACTAFAADSHYTSAQLDKIFEEGIAKPGYDQYAQDFAQYDNSLHHDDRCFSMAGGQVTLYLVIDKDGDVEPVTADDLRSRCFKSPYIGAHFKAPPFAPLVLKMQF